MVTMNFNQVLIDIANGVCALFAECQPPPVLHDGCCTGMPDTLNVSISNNSDCPCMDGVSFTLTWSGVHNGWIGSGSTGCGSVGISFDTDSVGACAFDMSGGCGIPNQGLLIDCEAGTATGTYSVEGCCDEIGVVNIVISW